MVGQSGGQSVDGLADSPRDGPELCPVSVDCPLICLLLGHRKSNMHHFSDRTSGIDPDKTVHTMVLSGGQSDVSVGPSGNFSRSPSDSPTV